jgi:hypothetical protein
MSARLPLRSGRVSYTADTDDATTTQFSGLTIYPTPL